MLDLSKPPRFWICLHLKCAHYVADKPLLFNGKPLSSISPLPDCQLNPTPTASLERLGLSEKCPYKLEHMAANYMRDQNVKSET